MQARSAETARGSAVYSPLVLSLYDLWVLGFSCSVVWQCPAKRLVQHYERHLGRVHLDVGVGSGYFLERAQFPTPVPEITLFDLNSNSLLHTARRIAHYTPRVVQGDVLQENQLPRAHFDSIALSFLMHCLPDSADSKWQAFDRLLPALAPGGTLFGSTILGASPPRMRQRWLMGVYNKKGVFGNASDSLERLEQELRQRFAHVSIEQQGVVALFAAREPRSRT